MSVNKSRKYTRLRDIAAVGGISILRDSEFTSVGLISHNRPMQLVFLEDQSYIPALLRKENIAAVITTPELAKSIPTKLGLATCAAPMSAFYSIHNYLARSSFYATDFRSWISKSAKIHRTAFVARKNVIIGDECEIHPQAAILEGSILGRNVIVRAGSVVGTEGFQFPRIGNEVVRVIHAGGVKLHDRVEVQANCAISKAIFGGFTEVGEDTKLDNLVHVAHDVVIGKRCRIAASAMIAGSASIGNDVWIGPSAAISSEVHVGDGADVTLGSVVTQNVAAGCKVTGNFAINHDRFIKNLKRIR